ncbi:hypothetical protein EJ02DRAFT_390324, partial [Clathrospora elynae]
MTTKTLTRRQARWAKWLAAFHFNIQHCPGRTNPADRPSRQPDYEPDRDGCYMEGESHNKRLLRELQEKLQLHRVSQ